MRWTATRFARPILGAGIKIVIAYVAGVTLAASVLSVVIVALDRIQPSDRRQRGRLMPYLALVWLGGSVVIVAGYLAAWRSVGLIPAMVPIALAVVSFVRVAVQRDSGQQLGLAGTALLFGVGVTLLLLGGE